MVKVRTYLYPQEYLSTDKNITGLTALIALGILDQLEDQGKIKSLLELEHNSAEYLHALVETLR